jgi:hypothetical protein
MCRDIMTAASGAASAPVERRHFKVIAGATAPDTSRRWPFVSGILLPKH